jgi:predicted amidohydrolase
MRGEINDEMNIGAIERAIKEAAGAGACFYFAPEMSFLLDRNRERSASSIFTESQTPAIARICKAAFKANIWVHLGSVAVRRDDNPAMLANRTIVIGPDGMIRARYDKIHLFDVDLSNGESWRESAAYVAGDQVSIVQTPIGAMGLTICYDLRFPELYRQLLFAGAEILTVPAAFTHTTGEAHWHILLRARAIENSAFVIAAAQTGHHADGRQTYGHSLVVDPWGTVLLDMGTGEGLGFATIDRGLVGAARRQLGTLHNARLPAPGQRRDINP